MEKAETFGILNIYSIPFKTRLSKKFLNRKKYTPANPGLVICHIPGTVVDILVNSGQKIGRGDGLLIIDSMKMQNTIKSGIEGTVSTINVKKGAKVAKGSVLMELKIPKAGLDE